MTPPTTFGPWMPAQNRMDWSEATIVSADTRPIGPYGQ